MSEPAGGDEGSDDDVDDTTATEPAGGDEDGDEDGPIPADPAGLVQMLRSYGLPVPRGARPSVRLMAETIKAHRHHRSEEEAALEAAEAHADGGANAVPRRNRQRPRSS